MTVTLEHRGLAGAPRAKRPRPKGHGAAMSEARVAVGVRHSCAALAPQVSNTLRIPSKSPVQSRMSKVESQHRICTMDGFHIVYDSVVAGAAMDT